MKTVYLINEIVLFDPKECSLTPRKSWPLGRTTIHAPAAECLHLLLAHPWQPVTQKVLFAQVWEKKGVVVSTNTLYQSIASIRKGLKTAGLEEDIIRTLPKQGFQCNATIQFGALEEFIPPVVTTNMREPVPLSSVMPAEPSAVITAPAAPEKKYRLALSCLLTLAIITGFLLWNNQADDALPIPYYPAGNIENCTLNSSWSGAEYSQSVFNELRQRAPIDCSKKHIAYLTINRLQIGSTLVLCDVPIHHDNAQCRIIMFRDKENENK